MVGRLGDVKEVRDQTTHEVARLVAVKEREAHALVGVKEVLAHAALHASAHDVAPEAHKVAAAKAHQVHEREPRGQVDEGTHDGVGALAKDASGAGTQDLREGQVNAGHGQRAGYVRHKQAHLALVVREELPHQLARSALHAIPFGAGRADCEHKRKPAAAMGRRLPFKSDEKCYSSGVMTSMPPM